VKAGASVSRTRRGRERDDDTTRRDGPKTETTRHTTRTHDGDTTRTRRHGRHDAHTTGPTRSVTARPEGPSPLLGQHGLGYRRTGATAQPPTMSPAGWDGSSGRGYQLSAASTMLRLIVA